MMDKPPERLSKSSLLLTLKARKKTLIEMANGFVDHVTLLASFVPAKSRKDGT